MPENDFTYVNHGSVGILHAWSVSAKVWVSEHIPDDAQGWGRNGIVVEPRYIDDIIHGIECDGLTVGG